MQRAKSLANLIFNTDYQAQLNRKYKLPITCKRFVNDSDMQNNLSSTRTLNQKFASRSDFQNEISQINKNSINQMLLNNPNQASSVAKKIQKLFYSNTQQNNDKITLEASNNSQLKNKSKNKKQLNAITNNISKRFHSTHSSTFTRQPITEEDMEKCKQRKIKFVTSDSLYQFDFKNYFNKTSKKFLPKYIAQDESRQKKTENEQNNEEENIPIDKSQIKVEPDQKEENEQTPEVETYLKTFEIFVDELLKKNPDYFKHLTGQCICYQTNFKQRCNSNGDQNFFKILSLFQTLYNDSFSQSQPAIQDINDQISNPLFIAKLQSLVSGKLKESIVDQTINQVQFFCLFCNKKVDFQKPTQIDKIPKHQHQLITKEPLLYKNSSYHNSFLNFFCPLIPFSKIRKQFENSQIPNGFKFNGKTTYSQDFIKFNNLQNQVFSYQKQKLGALFIIIFYLSLFENQTSSQSNFVKHVYEAQETPNQQNNRYEPLQNTPNYKNAFISIFQKDYNNKFNQKQIYINENEILSQIKQKIIS